MKFRFSDFEIDVARHELRRRGELVQIEPQVFSLLVHLIQNRHRVVSKNEIIDVIWQGRVISEAAISSRVSAARRAIGDSGSDQLFIRTNYKRGFHFVGKIDWASQPLGAIATNLTQMPAVNCEAMNVAPAKPSMAVLPFQNISGDPRQEFLADGLTEDIITGLSRQRWFSVVARSSSLAFKGEAIDVRKVARALGVRYVLVGSVRTAANRVRVTGQLIDAGNRTHLWADRYDRDLTNISAVQDDIANRLVDSVGSQIVMAEAARAGRGPSYNIDASGLVTQAIPHMWRMSTHEQRFAQELLQQAVTRDTKCAHAHALLGLTYVNLFNLDSHAPMSELTEKALDTAGKALTLDDQDPWGHMVLGLSHARRRRPEAAFRHLTKSIALRPEFALGHAGLGYALACGGQPERGLESLERARQLSPLDPFVAMYAPVVRYMALFALERYEETITVCRSMAARYPRHAGARRLMTVSLGLLGRTDQASESLEQTLALQPDLSSDHVARSTVYANAADRSRFLLGLQKAGLRD